MSEATNDMPKVNPRNRVETEAQLAVRNALSEHDLTPAEEVRLLTQMASEMTKYLLRMERHGDYETPADVASDG